MFNFLLRQKVNTGFTLVEVLLGIALLGIVAGMSAPFFQSFYERNDLDVATDTIVQTARRAQLLSQAIDGDSSWGINLATANVTLFKGASYASRDTDFDETIAINPTINITGVTELVFSRLYGQPQVSGDINILSTNLNESRIININAQGIFTY